ncbi:MAG TPA: hypothetical protein PKA41_07395 [Verrucomicrobiota bacterium]|nr:hypothetical protein [Verrucomicrobiota bacterium]
MACAAGVENSPEARAPSRIQLNNQFDRPESLIFPSTNVTVVLIADRKGAEQIAGWIAPLKEQFGTNIAIRGIADVSGVPGLLRNAVRKRFQRDHPHPLMLDWTGETCAAFQHQRGVANAIVVDRDGLIRGRFTGAATDNNLNRTIALLSALISKRTDSSGESRAFLEEKVGKKNLSRHSVSESHANASETSFGCLGVVRLPTPPGN